MPTALIDTNLLIATCYSRRALQSPFLLAWQRNLFTWIISEPLLEEFIAVASRPEHRARIRAGVPEHIAHLLRLGARWVIPLPLSECPPCRDPNDAIVILTALAEPAEFIVTLDKDLLEDDDLNSALLRRGVRIALPTAFLSAMR